MKEIAGFKNDSLHHPEESECNKKQLVVGSIEHLHSSPLPIYVCAHPESKDRGELKETIECIVIVTKNQGQSQPISIPYESIPCEVWVQIQKALFNFNTLKNEQHSLAEESMNEFSPGIKVLTLREKEILELLCDGLLYKEIAEELGISALTVKNHLRNIYPKLKVANRSEAIVKYLGHFSVTCHCRQKFRAETM
jgi:RNA polymerase sigma factor (sigma-70 family)